MPSIGRLSMDTEASRLVTWRQTGHGNIVVKICLMHLKWNECEQGEIKSAWYGPMSARQMQQSMACGAFPALSAYGFEALVSECSACLNLTGICAWSDRSFASPLSSIVSSIALYTSALDSPHPLFSPGN